MFRFSLSAVFAFVLFLPFRGNSADILQGENLPDPQFNVTVANASGQSTNWSRSAFLADGRFYIAQGFISVNGIERRGIARLKQDGSLDHTFNYPGGVSPTAVAVQKDGRVLVAGLFENEDNTGGYALARLHPDGAFDRFLARSISGSVASIAVRPDGSIFIFGDFGSVAGVSRRRIARLLPDGGLDPNFIPPSISISGTVNGGLALPGDRALLYGRFSVGAGSSNTSVAIFDPSGAHVETFNPKFNGSSVSVYTVMPREDGSILVGGVFSQVNGISRTNLVRLFPDGSLDEAFTATPDGEVRSLFPLQDGRIFASVGYFNTAQGYSSNVIRFLPDGAIDASFPVTAVPARSLTGVMANGTLLLNNGTRLGPQHVTSPLEITPANVIIWHRSDSLGEIRPPALESRTAGSAEWAGLGAPVKITNGWKITAPSFLATGAIRAYGQGEPRDNAPAADAAYLSLGSQAASVRILTRDGQVIGNGGIVDFGSTISIDPRPLVVTIENTSSATISGLTATIEGAHSAEFTLEGLSADSIPPYGSALARIRFTGIAPGVRLAILSIAAAPDTVSAQISLQGEIGTTYMPVIHRYSQVNVAPADFSADAYQLGTFDLGFDPVAGRTITLIRGANPGLGTFQNAPEGAIIQGRFQGELFNFRISYSNSAGNRTVIATFIPYGGIDTAFNPSLSSFVTETAAVQADGKIIVAGTFTQADNQPHGRIARLNVDGTVDHTFRASLNGSVESLVIQPDGKIVICGTFTLVNQITHPYLARLFPDGSLDDSFITSTDGSVSRITPLPNGGFVGIGDFTLVNDVPRVGIVRLHADGQVDTSFDAGLQRLTARTYYSVLVMDDGRILLGGAFNLPDGSLSHLTCFLLDGSIDPSFQLVTDDWVSALVRDRSGRIIIAGHFDTINGTSHSKIARVFQNGTMDPTFMPEVIDRGFGSVTVQANGKMVVCGHTNYVGGVARRAVARLHENGQLDNSFTVGYTGIYHIRAVVLSGTGQGIICGEFSSIGGLSRRGIARLQLESGEENLQAEADRLRWFRSGAVAEVDSAQFSASADGRTWTTLGNATRIAGGWELAGITPPIGFIRVEGRHSISNRGFGRSRGIVLQGRSLTALETWRQTHFGSPLPEGAGANLHDADDDGLANLVEYSLGLSPKDPASRAAPVWARSGDGYETAFTPPAGITEIIYDAEWSTSLKPDEWYPAENLTEGSLLRFRVPTGNAGSLYMRLRFDQP